MTCTRHCVAPIIAAVAIPVLLIGDAFAGDDWVQFEDETASRLIASAPLGATDTEEKDYAWGDIDKDPHAYMEIAFAQRRRRIAGELHQLKVDVDHFNEANPNDEPIQLSLNFEDDVLERLVDEGLVEAA